MWQKVTEAIEQKNFTQAQELLEQQQFDDQDANNLWKRYYQARIEEEQKNWEVAETQYRQIIADSIYPNPKLTAKIRDGIERILSAKQEQKSETIKQFEAIDNSDDLAVLILQPVSLEEKKLLAPHFAQIMEIERYTATLQIPTRSWRIYKTGNYGHLSYYQTQLSEANIPCFCQRVEQINQITVYQVKYIKSALEELILVCENDQRNEQVITLKWHEINQRVEGMIPLFESTINIDVLGKLEKKQSTLDYAQFYDIHSCEQNLILRFSDHFYQFEQGVSFLVGAKTALEKWKNLLSFFGQKITAASEYANFTLFAESLMQFPEMLKQINSHINLLRQQEEETFWDEAFQLYSGLILGQCRSASNKSN